MTQDRVWYFEDKGKRKGPVSEIELNELINMGKVTYGTAIWKAGFSGWVKVEDTEFRHQLATISAPPLLGKNVNNTIVWIVAFAPIIGLFLEYVISGAVYGDNMFAQLRVKSGEFWYVTLTLNLILCALDERYLKSAGHNTNNFLGWVWLIPVYLYKRAKTLDQGPAYLIVWCICFALAFFNLV